MVKSTSMSKSMGMSNDMEVEIEHILLFGIVAFAFYYFFLRKCRGCGSIMAKCKCRREGFTPLDTIQTALSDDINNPSCCISNTAGYNIDPVAISPSAPGFASRTAYANPCGGN